MLIQNGLVLTASWTAREGWRWGMGLRMWIDNGSRLTPVEDPDLVTNFSSIYDTNILTSLWKRPHRRWASRHWQTSARTLSVSGVLQKSALFLEPLKKKSKADKMERFLTSLNFDPVTWAIVSQLTSSEEKLRDSALWHFLPLIHSSNGFTLCFSKRVWASRTYSYHLDSPRESSFYLYNSHFCEILLEQKFLNKKACSTLN